MGRPFKPRPECLMCGQHTKRFGKKFCSRECSSQHRVLPILEKREHRECLTCHGLFSEKPSLMDRGRQFCSKRCADKAKEKSHDFVCVKCGVPKAPQDFYVDRNKPRGHVSRCKSCYSETASKVIAFKPYRRESAFQSGASRRGLAYELTRDQFMEFWQKPCVYCGDHIETVGLDRVDNGKGYVVGNIVPCCSICNAMKSAMSLEKFVARCQMIAARSIELLSSSLYHKTY